VLVSDKERQRWVSFELGSSSLVRRGGSDVETRRSILQVAPRETAKA